MKNQKNTMLSDEELKDIKAKASKILEACRNNMLTRQPFIGSVALSFNIIPVRDARCETACTDGKAIYFDIDYLSKLTDAEREFTIAHEIWHNIMMHFLRAGERDHRIFNYATDMEINEILKNDGLIPQKGLIFPETFNLPSGKCAEEYYDMLMDQAKYNTSLQNNGKGDGKSGNGGGSSNGPGNQKGMQFDKHVYEGEDVDEEKESERTDRFGKVGRDSDFRPSSTESDVERVREAVVSAAQRVERMRGELPAYVKKLVEGMLEPKISWREVLAAQITSALCDKTNWNLPNRRFAYNGVYLPAHMGEKIKIGVGVDTSGSCSDQFIQFISEINSIAKTFGNYEIHVIQCDTEVKKYDFFDESNPMDFENNPIEFNGNGGTVLRPIMDYVDLNELDIDTLVMFTDGYCETFAEQDAPEYRVIWAITGGYGAENIEFGEKIALAE